MTSAFLSNLIPAILILAALGGCATTAGGGRPAIFSAQNLQEIPLSPYYLSDPSMGSDHAWYMKLRTSNQKKPVAGFLKPNQMLTESLTRAIFALQPVSGKLLSSSDGKQAKGCNGWYSAQVSMKPGGAFSGALTFSSYSDDFSLVLDGQAPFSGKMNITTGETEVVLSLPPLAAQLAEKKLQLSGTLKLTFNAFQGEKQLVSTESRMDIADESRLRFSLRPVTFKWDRRGKFRQEYMDGQFLIDPYGVVQIKTTSPLQFTQTGTKPMVGGTLNFYDANGRTQRLLFHKEGAPGFFRLDGENNFKTIGEL